MTNRNFLLAIVLSLVLSLTVIVACGDDDDDDDDGENDDDSTDDDTVNPDDDDDDDDDHTPDIDWAVIPKFAFNMGCQEGDDLCNADELPLHTVTVDAFDMATTETTQAQFQAVMGHNPSYFHTGYHDSDSEDKSNHPVEGVTWQEASDFCEAIGGRLPTEAEWESAARCGSQTIFVCGDDPACVLDYGRVWDNLPDTGENTAPVGQYEANVCGLYDVTGNVAEWVNDWYLATYYEVSPDDSPPGPGAGGKKTIRGGGYSATVDDDWLRWSLSDRVEYDFDAVGDGFRCARD